MRPFGNWSDISRSISSSSALNPALLAILMVSFPGLLLSAFAPAPINYALLGIGCLPVIVALWQIVHFTNKDPYQLRNDRLVQRLAEMRMGARDAAGQEVEITIEQPERLTENPMIEGGEK